MLIVKNWLVDVNVGCDLNPKNLNDFMTSQNIIIK
jgi:hypothetical protein